MLCARPGCARPARLHMHCALVQRRSCSRRFAALYTPSPGGPALSDAAGRRSSGRFRHLRTERTRSFEVDEGRSEPEVVFCPVDGNGRRLWRPVAVSLSTATARAKEAIPSHRTFLAFHVAFLRSCMIRSHPHPWPAGQAAPPHFLPVPSRVRPRIRPAAHSLTMIAPCAASLLCAAA